MWLLTADRKLAVNLDQVAWVEAENGRLVVHFKGGMALVLEELPPGTEFRAVEKICQHLWASGNRVLDLQDLLKILERGSQNRE